MRHTLQGTVQKLGSHWRVSIRLFDATTHKITLSEQHDFVLDSAFEVQDEIGRRVVESLQTRFPLAVPRSRDRYSSDPMAYSEFMAGLSETSADGQETLRNAAQHLSRAVELDPEFALAHATLAFGLDEYPLTASTPSPPGCSVPRTTAAGRWRSTRRCPRATWRGPGSCGARRRTSSTPTPSPRSRRCWPRDPIFERAHNRMAGICLQSAGWQEARIAHEHGPAR